MTAVIVALVGVALLVALAVAVAWQERNRPAETSIVYGVEESIDFVYARLGEAPRSVLTRSDVRRMLEWSIRFLQDPATRAGPRAPVAGGIEAARYVQERSLEAGFAYDADLVFEVLSAQNAYLASLGAVGGAVDEDPAPGAGDGESG
jgi:hypothetical protein